MIHKKIYIKDRISVLVSVGHCRLSRNRTDYKMSDCVYINEWVSTGDRTCIPLSFLLAYSQALNKKDPATQEFNVCGCKELVCPGCGVRVNIRCLITSKDATSDDVKLEFTVHAVRVETRVAAALKTKLVNIDWTSHNKTFECSGLRELSKTLKDATKNVESVVCDCMAPGAASSVDRRRKRQRK